MSFREKACNNISVFQSAEEFATKLSGQVRDQHEWDGSATFTRSKCAVASMRTGSNLSLKVKTTTQSMSCPVHCILLHMKYSAIVEVHPKVTLIDWKLLTS